MVMKRETARALDIVAGVVLTLAAIGYIVFLLIGREGFDYSYIAESYPLFLGAAKLTIYATTVSFVAGLGIGFLVGWARTAR
ncbi:MAG TPA: hypothetical protein VJN63_09985, partial [Thermoplasmata archaeon]|nr:hypothetical protein [Thermoplasmata archaeon]